jgi:hypothetical protein
VRRRRPYRPCQTEVFRSANHLIAA